LHFDNKEKSILFNNILKEMDYLNELKHITNTIMFNLGYFNKNIEDRINKFDKYNVPEDIKDSVIKIMEHAKNRTELLLKDVNEFIFTENTNIETFDNVYKDKTTTELIKEQYALINKKVAEESNDRT
jgi:hypothetical protein